MTLVAVAPGFRNRGVDGSGRRVSACYEAMELRSALERTYNTDAHMVSYVVRGASHQPRINKTGIDSFDGIVETHAFVCDIDNPGHAEWTDEWVAEALRAYDTLPILQAAGMHHTRRGRHIIQPLAEPVPVQKVEPYLRRWLLALEAAGLAVDWSCKDWTRHFRLPNVRRPEGVFRSPLVRYDRMVPIALEPLPEERPAERSAPRARRMATPVTWSSELPPRWEERAAGIAKAIRESVTERWHDMYLALGGALLVRKTPPEHLPALIGSIAHAAGSVKPLSHEQSARDTARAYADGRPTTGMPTLRAGWPAVARAVEGALATPREETLRSQLAAAPRPPPLAESLRALEDAIRRAPDGLTVISAECGIGKTRAAMEVACERAAKRHASSDADGARAPLGAKTSISVDKNALAIQIADGLRAKGVAVRRLFGPLSVLREDGTKECRFADAAGPLVDGGQPMQWELCQGRGIERCEFYESCRARDGLDGASDARITIGPHALLRELDAAAGSTGLLVIDEPPAVLETITLSRDDLQTARRQLDAFDGQFSAAMAPALDGFTTWLELAEDGTLAEPLAALQQARPTPDAWAYSATGVARTADGAADAIACAARALREDRRSQAPPIQRSHIFAAKRSIKVASELGTASKVLGTVRRALMSKTPVAVRAENRGLVFTSVRPDVQAALRREGPVVVTDANAEVHLPVYEKVVGYAPQVHRFPAADGAPIARTLVKCSSANRTGWFVHGTLVVDAVVPALRVAMEWARERDDDTRLGLITPQLVRLVLEGMWIGKPEPAVPKEVLAEAHEKLLPVMRTWAGEIIFGHYGATRGLNTMADVDALITLGDPWPNLGDVRADVAFLGLPGAWEARLEALCRAELEQAHGRLRAVHRARRGRALHVGFVPPSGYGWTSGIETREMPRGRNPMPFVMPPEEVRALVAQRGGARAAARELGCGTATMIRYCAGQRPVPPALAALLRQRRPALGGDPDMSLNTIS